MINHNDTCIYRKVRERQFAVNWRYGEEGRFLIELKKIKIGLKSDKESAQALMVEFYRILEH